MKLSTLIAVAVCAALLALMALGDTDDGTLATYCEMRQVWQDTDGEWGWREDASHKYSDEDC